MTRSVMPQRGLRTVLAVLAATAALVAVPAANADDVPNATIDQVMLALGALDVADNAAYEAARVVGASCETSHICAWPDSSFTGRRGKWQFDNKDFRKFSTQACDDDSSAGSGTLSWNDCASSIKNQGTQCDNRWYLGINWSGGYYYHQRGTGLSSLGSYNDTFSGNRWVGCTSN